MKQLSFLDNSETYCPPAKDLARTTDPAPSHVAAETKSETGGVESDEQAILNAIGAARTRDDRIPGSKGSLTAKEIAKAAGWMLGDKPDNVRVSRRVAKMEHNSLIVATGLRRSFDDYREQPITSYALEQSCCGKPENWTDAELNDKQFTRQCDVCGEALGVEFLNSEK